MKKAALLCLPFSFILLLGCQDSSQNIQIQELQGELFVIDQNDNSVYRVDKNTLVPLKKNPLAGTILDRNVIKTTLSVWGDLQVDAQFKVESGKISYRLILEDKKFTQDQLNPVAAGQPDPTEEYEGLKIIRAIADPTSSSDRFDRLILAFLDSDGFKTIEHDIALSQVKLTRYWDSEKNVNSLLIEGEIRNSAIDERSIAEIRLAHNGFEL